MDTQERYSAHMPPSTAQPSTQGARRPSRAWLTWAAVVTVLLYLPAQMRLLPISPLALMAVFIVLMILNAIRFWPGKAEPVRRRLPALLLLAFPWIVSLVWGPLVLAPRNPDPVLQNQLILLQNVSLVASAILPLVLLPALRGARRLALALGILNFIATFMASTLAMFVLAPNA